MPEHQRTFVLDTSVLLADPFALLRFDEHEVVVPVVVITAKDLTAEDHQRLNGYVAAIVQKSAYSREELLAEVRNLLATSVRQPAPGRTT